MRGMGVMDEEAWIDYLDSEVGVKLDRDRLHYWKALNFFKGVCIDQPPWGSTWTDTTARPTCWRSVRRCTSRH